METKFTKGEWEYTPDCISNVTGFYIQTVDKSHRNSFIGNVGGGLQLKQEIEANAKLIVAAPEMFKVLVDISETSSESIPDFIIDMVNKAIKKATE